MGSVLIIAFALSTKSPATTRRALPLLVVQEVSKQYGGVVCFAKFLSVFIQYLKCGIDVTFCSGRLRLFS